MGKGQRQTVSKGAKKSRRKLERPLRTRQHYIEAICRNYFERLVLQRGHIVDEPRPDYGYDVVIQTFDYGGDPRFERGQFENGQIFVQLKATEQPDVLADGDTISFSIKRQHAILWTSEPMPVYLVVYSVASGECYWLHMQPYLNSNQFVLPPLTQDQVTVHLSKRSVVDVQTVDAFRDEKNRVLTEIERIGLYD